MIAGVVFWHEITQIPLLQSTLFFESPFSTAVTPILQSSCSRKVHMASVGARCIHDTAAQDHDHPGKSSFEPPTARSPMSGTRKSGTLVTESMETEQQNDRQGLKYTKRSSHVPITAEGMTTNHEITVASEDPVRPSISDHHIASTSSGSCDPSELQVIPDDDARVRAYSSSMARLAANLLKDLTQSGTGTGVLSKSAWSPDSEPHSYGFDTWIRYYEDEL